jgi:hypothetical protein
VIRGDDKGEFFLCHTCKEAFEWGQASPDHQIVGMDDEIDDDEKEEDSK